MYFHLCHQTAVCNNVNINKLTSYGGFYLCQQQKSQIVIEKPNSNSKSFDRKVGKSCKGGENG